MQNYDIILIGTGQATGTLVGPLQKMGRTLAIVEGGRVGGTCVNYGCSPTKTLVASARAAHMARRGPDFGVITGEVKVDFQKVMQRQNDLRNSWSQGMANWLESAEGVTLYRAYARFTGPNTIQVGDEEIWGDLILIHTGARPRAVDLPGLDEVNWMTNRDLLDLTDLPQHLIIVGGSYISIEFAQAFRRFGSEVTILERADQLMFREDADIAQAAREVLEGEGVQVYCNATVGRASKGDEAPVTIHFTQGGDARTASGSHLLIAAGRVPNTDTLNLEAAGVTTNERGYVTVNDVGQTNVPHIFALGDVNGRGAFTHTSVNDGEVFLDNLQGGERRITDRITTYGMYMDPPLGRVGMSEKQARESGRNILMATRPMAAISRAKEKDETAGLVKLLVDADTEEFVGATILGTGGDEIIAMFATFMMAGASYQVFRRTVINHPTVAELMPWILDDLAPLT